MKLKKIFYLVFATVLIYILFLTPKVNAATKVTYDGTIDESKYPGYKTLLDNIKSTYGYNIELYYTGVDWNEATVIQYQGHGSSAKNLFYESDTRTGMWYCPICGNKEYDTGIPCASLEAISYMLDPRNSLADESIYQFMNFSGNNLTKEQVAVIVQDTFLNETEVIEAIYDAAVTYDLNAAFLVAKIIIEQGSSGSVLSKGEGYNGNYIGVYNYFNFGATGATKDAVITNGLATASSNGWTSKRASILGGASIIKSQYVDSRGQISFYFMKFNYAGKEAYGSMQYEQNVMGAESKGRILRTYYKKLTDLTTPTMVIPVYENMPATAVSRPDTSKVNSISYEEGIITNVSSGLRVRASGGTSGYNLTTLSNGTAVKIVKRAETTIGNLYWDLIYTDSGVYGYAAREINGDVCITGTGVYGTSYGKNNSTLLSDGKQVLATDDGIIHMTPTVLVEDIKTVYPTAIVRATDGNEMTSGVIGTYSKVEIDGKTYTVAKRGDVDGDGYATILDVIKLFNHSKQIEYITDSIRFQAGRITNGTKITILDVTSLLNYVKGTGTVSLY